MTIVVGYVPRDEVKAAVRLAAREAKLRNTKLLVAGMGNVGEPQTSQGASHYKDEIAEVRQRVSESLTEVEETLTNAGVEYELRTVISSEEPSHALTQLAESENADFVVIGLRRRSPVGKFVFGSNAQKILLNAPCPVIAVHADDA